MSSKSETSALYRGSCHCGAVEYSLLVEPKWLISCNCSICHRLGALWAPIEKHEVILTYSPDAILPYAWAEKNIEFSRCRTCGCTTHWSDTDQTERTRMAMNFRMCPKDAIDAFRIRHFDGADTWAFLDE